MPFQETKDFTTPPHGTRSVKEDIIKDFDLFYGEAPDGSLKHKRREEIKDWLSSALDHYAMAVVEASVPEPIDPKAEGCPEDCLCGYCLSEVIPLNDFREATLTKAREITNQ